MRGISGRGLGGEPQVAGGLGCGTRRSTNMSIQRSSASSENSRWLAFLSSSSARSTRLSTSARLYMPRSSAGPSRSVSRTRSSRWWVSQAPRPSWKKPFFGLSMM